jgi:hypothetical protein
VEFEKDVKDGNKSRDDLKARSGRREEYMHYWCGGVMCYRTMGRFFIWDNKI